MRAGDVGGCTKVVGFSGVEGCGGRGVLKKKVFEGDPAWLVEMDPSPKAAGVNGLALSEVLGGVLKSCCYEGGMSLSLVAVLDSGCLVASAKCSLSIGWGRVDGVFDAWTCTMGVDSFLLKWGLLLVGHVGRQGEVAFAAMAGGPGGAEAGPKAHTLPWRDLQPQWGAHPVGAGGPSPGPCRDRGVLAMPLAACVGGPDGGEAAPRAWREDDALAGEDLQEGLVSEEVDAPREGASSVRSSPRLAAKEALPSLRKAVMLRARREEAENFGEGRRSRRRSKKKLRAKSALCGVALNEGELDAFEAFVTLKG